MSFTPPEPPFTPDAVTPPPTLGVPYAPPEVGMASPWAPADGENRDQILDWWRMWWLQVFFPWVAAFTAYWNAQWARLAAYVNTWISSADSYINEHSVAGYSWRTTATPINAGGNTDVTIAAPDPLRPLEIGDLVSDQSAFTRYGIVVAVIDSTHATVTEIGSLVGLPGLGWVGTATPIAHGGNTDVIIVPDATHPVQLGDFIVDTSPSHAYGLVSAITDGSHATVSYVGTLQGPAGVADIGAFDFVTPTLAPAAAYQGQMAAEPNMVGAYRISVDHPAWVRVYASEAYMLADQTRDVLTPLDIAADHGCYLDFVGNLTELSKTLTPGVQITDLGSGVWLSVVNTDPINPAAVAVHFDYRIFRE